MLFVFVSVLVCLVCWDWVLSFFFPIFLYFFFFRERFFVVFFVFAVLCVCVWDCFCFIVLGGVFFLAEIFFFSGDIVLFFGRRGEGVIVFLEYG